MFIIIVIGATIRDLVIAAMATFRIVIVFTIRSATIRYLLSTDRSISYEQISRTMILVVSWFLLSWASTRFPRLLGWRTLGTTWAKIGTLVNSCALISIKFQLFHKLIASLHTCALRCSTSSFDPLASVSYATIRSIINFFSNQFSAEQFPRPLIFHDKMYWAIARDAGMVQCSSNSVSDAEFHEEFISATRFVLRTIEKKPTDFEVRNEVRKNQKRTN